MTILLRGGFETKDPRLDRLPQFDEKSRAFPIRTLLAPLQVAKPRSYTWHVGVSLDQGQEGACVGFAWAQELAARPIRIRMIDDAFARNFIYHRAQQIDEWPGESYEGTSVLAGVKVCRELGYIGEYRWAFSEEELMLAVGYKGPAVIGVNWYDGMFSTNAEGFIRPTGAVAGGHAILVKAVKVASRSSGPEEFYTVHNSWGPGWGKHGTAKITREDMAKLLEERGEACIPIKRRLHA